MSFKRVLLYDKRSENMRDPDPSNSEPFDFIPIRSTPSTSSQTPQVQTPLTQPMSKVADVPENGNDIKIDENFFKFIEDIVKRYLENNLTKLMKGIKHKKKIPKMNKTVKKAKKILKTNKIVDKKIKTKKPVNNSTLNWIYK